MRVAMYYSNRDIRVEEMPVPEPGPGELLVKVWASGICINIIIADARPADNLEPAA